MAPKDDKEVEKFLINEYIYLHKVGLFYASWDGNNRYLAILQYIIYYAIMAYMMLSFLITAYLCMDDIAIFSQSIHIVIVGMVAWTVSLTGLCFRNEFIAVHAALIRDYKEFECETFLQGERRVREKEKKALLIFWPCYYGFCAAIATIISPMVDSYLGVYPHVNVKNGVYLKLPVPLWSPFDVENSTTAFVVVLLLSAAFAALLALMVSSGVLYVVFVLQHICVQLKLLSYLIKDINNQTIEEYNKRYPHSQHVTMNDERYWQCYEHCLKRNIRLHQTIIRHQKRFKKLSHIPLSTPIIGGAILLAMAGIHILSDDQRIGPKMTSFFLIFGEMLNMLMLCVFGEKLKQLGEDIRESVYSIEWYNGTPSIKKLVSIMCDGAVIPLVLKAGNLVELNMETFGTIINSAYSYFNLIYAMKEKS